MNNIIGPMTNQTRYNTKETKIKFGAIIHSLHGKCQAGNILRFQPLFVRVDTTGGKTKRMAA